MIMMNSDDEKYYKLIKPEESVASRGAQEGGDDNHDNDYQ